MTSSTPSSSSSSPDVPRTHKSFTPLENNPEVMTALVRGLGLSTALAFHDVYTLDDPELLGLVPRPAVALLLVFPVSRAYEEHRVEEDAGVKEAEVNQQRLGGDGGGRGEQPVIWYKQTIRNACGLIGVLHAVSNGPARTFIQDDSDLADLITRAAALAPSDRADLLYESSALETAHQRAAAGGQTTAPDAADDIDLHYVCFVKDERDGHLWELDGRRKGPLDRGVLGPDEDVLSPAALDRGPRRFIQREESRGVGELRFSLVALAPSLD